MGIRDSEVCDRRCGRKSVFFLQAEDGMRCFCLSCGLGDVYKRQVYVYSVHATRYTRGVIQKKAIDWKGVNKEMD